MLHLVVVVVVIGISGLTEGCGKRPVGARVVGGVNALPHSWPWQISLRVSGRHICGGSLIKPDWVITAAHCVVRNPNPSAYTVVVGAHKRTGTTAVQQTFRLKQLYSHKKFSMRNLRSDIALLHLDRPAKLSEKVNVVCLPAKESRVAPGTKCFITGWGRVVGGGSAANTLQQAELPVVAQSKCSQRNSVLVPVDETTMLCAGTGVENQAGGCQGDSGGPFVCEEGGKWVLRGAVSWGNSMCRTKYYTVFARISSFIEWIEHIVKSGDESGCKDKSRFCRHAQRFCKWSRIARVRCPKTCGACGDSSSQCRDNSIRCPSFVSYCSYHPVVKARCKKTCRLC